MPLPAALAPLRHRLFRTLWLTNLVVSFGVWMQNTGAGWLMATLSPDALTVSLVSAATILPVFLLALPAGALDAWWTKFEAKFRRDPEFLLHKRADE